MAMKLVMLRAAGELMGVSERRPGERQQPGHHRSEDSRKQKSFSFEVHHLIITILFFNKY